MGRVSAASVDITKGVAGVNIHGKTLRIDFMYRGVRCRETLGIPATKQNVKYAAGLLASVKHEIAIGKFSYAARFPDSKNAARFGGSNAYRSITVSDLMDRFATVAFSDLSAVSVTRYATAIRVCVGIIGGDRLVSALMPEDIDRFRAELIATRRPSTATKYVSIIKRFLEYSEANEYTSRKLSMVCRPFRQAMTDPDPLTVDEVGRVMDICRLQSTKNLIRLAVYTGLRTGELCALAWDDVDMEQGIMTVRRNITHARDFKLPKTGKPRVVFLLPPAIEALRSQQAITAMWPEVVIKKITAMNEAVVETVRPVFRPEALTDLDRRIRPETFYTPEVVMKIWRRLLRRAGVRYRSVYHTRHTYACWSLTSHGNIAFIAKQLGHADYSMLVSTYGRWMDESSQNEMRKLWDAMAENGHGGCQSVPKSSQPVKNAK